jgi:hypothetical protein
MLVEKLGRVLSLQPKRAKFVHSPSVRLQGSVYHEESYNTTYISLFFACVLLSVLPAWTSIAYCKV